jgi:hypothetical protein
MPKILWQNDRNEMTRRRANQMMRQNSMAELPQVYPESEGFKYAPMHSGPARGGKSYRQLLRDSQINMANPGNSISEMASDPASGASFGEEPMQSGAAGGDMRTDEDLYVMAKDTKVVDGKLVGPLAGFNDKRSKAFLKTYGPGGPLSPWATQNGGGNPELRGRLKSKLYQRGNELEFVNPAQNYNPSVPHYHDAVEEYTGLDYELDASPSGRFR